MSQQAIPIKLVIVGDGCVGKTCVLLSYTTDKFPTDYVPTVFENYAATVKIDNKMVNLGLWDTAGQEQYNSLRPLAYPNCDVFLITFSVIDPATFINARKKWYPQLQQNVPGVIKIFIGNKIDMREQYKSKSKNPKDAPIQKQTAKKIILDQFGPETRYFECSALSQEGLKQIFQQAMRMVIKVKSKDGKSEGKKKVDSQGAKCTFCNIF